eukprot:151840_1
MLRSVYLFKKYRVVFIMIMLFTGSTYIAALLLSSKLFGLDIFCSGLTKYEMGKLSKLKVFGAVLAENLPQLIIMSIYAVYKAEAPSNIFVMSCMSSLLSIISALLVYFMERRASNYDVVQYELELLKMNGVQLSKAEIHEISKKKECKKALGKSLGVALNIDKNLLEFGKVTILHNGVDIKIIHYLFAEDLTDNTHYSLVTDLYDNHRQQTDDVLSSHFGFKVQFSVRTINIQSQEMQNMSNQFADHKAYFALND